jgi:hypothetical protein
VAAPPAVPREVAVPEALQAVVDPQEEAVLQRAVQAVLRRAALAARHAASRAVHQDAGRRDDELTQRCFRWGD